MVTSDLVFLVLPGVGEAWYDSRDSHGGGNLTGIDHDEQLHQIIIDLSRPTLNDVDIFTTDWLTNLNTVHMYITSQLSQLSNITILLSRVHTQYDFNGRDFPSLRLHILYIIVWIVIIPTVSPSSSQTYHDDQNN